MTVEHNTTLAAEVGGEPPVLAIFGRRPDDDEAALTFVSIVWSDAPPPDEDGEPRQRRLRVRVPDDDGVNVDEVDPEVLPRLSCAHCLIDAHPELGRGMDLALEHYLVVRDPLTGEWSVSETGEFGYDDVLRARKQLGRDDP